MTTLESKISCYKLIIFIQIIRYSNSFELPDSDIGKNLDNRSPSFLLSLPKTLLNGKNETVCLSTNDISFPAKISIDLKIKDRHFLTEHNLFSEYSCFHMNVPLLKHLKEPHHVSIRAHVQMDKTSYSAHNQDHILIYPDKYITFIETDRPVYKPMDKVRFRILTLTNELLPPYRFQIQEVRIRNPLDMSVNVWVNVTIELGLAQLEFNLPKESLLGKWKIEASGVVRSFEVSKYVLPRFGVTIINAKILYYESHEFPITVCANYSYGQTVKGNAFIKVVDSHNNMKPVVQLKKMDNGCAIFILNNTQLNLQHLKENFLYDPKIQILITATATEHGTDRIEISTSKSLVVLKPYMMKFIGDRIFQPGLPYKGKLQLYYINKDLSNEVIEICYNLALRRSWNYLNNEQCKNFTIQNQESIDFHIMPLKSNVIHMQINARSLNQTNVADQILVIRLFSASNSYINIKRSSLTNVKCRTSDLFMIQYVTENLNEGENITFYYMIKTGNRIIQLEKFSRTVKKNYINYENELNHIIGSKHKYIKLNTAVDEFILRVQLDEKVISKYQILVYYNGNNSEVVAATKLVDIEPCLRNKVKASWAVNNAYPGEIATLTIKTSSPSLCSLTAVDKSIHFMNNYAPLNADILLKPFTVERESAPSNRKSCVPPVRRRIQASLLLKQDNEVSNESTWDFHTERRKRHVYSFAEDYDSYDIFSKFGVIIISNLKVVTKLCYSGPSIPKNTDVGLLIDFDSNSIMANAAGEYTTGHYDIQDDNRLIPIRSYFPETWLWELVIIRNDEPQHVQRTLPHTITNWATGVMCVSPSEGVGFSDPIQISAFQPFFIDVSTPYSIRRGEYLYLNIIIYNYLDHNIPISVSLGEHTGLQITDIVQHKSATYCVHSKETVTHIVQMLGVGIGEMNITVFAEVDSVYPGLCGPDVIINRKDVVMKKILIEPEGYPKEIIKSALLCSADPTSNNVTWDLQTPIDLVPNTAEAVITINGDLLGHSIENLEGLIALPTGCGEQIIATFAPNLYILRYLSATNKLTHSIRQRAIRNIKIGYQGILNYVHKDGSFSAFGYNDPIGSMFLTTFVVRTLQDAKQYIYVDQRIIDRAVTWILSYQLENGCFNTMLHVFQEMGGTSSENSTSALTAYVITSLLEANIHVPEKVINDAKYCIHGETNPDKYTMAVTAYALFKINWSDEANRLLNRILDMAQENQGKLWWTNRNTNNTLATDVELTSYVLLSLLHNNNTENLARAHSVVRWLTGKFGSRGGFKSTQDTVVALDALTKYATLINSQKLNVEVIIEAINQYKSLKISNEDKLKTRKIHLTTPNNKISVTVNGEGCILTQALLKFYTKIIPVSEFFKLSVDVQSVSNIDECSIAKLSPCLSYNGPDEQANMAVLEVTLPSGYQANRATLYKLVDPETHSRIAKFEENKNQVVLYLTKLNKEQVCFNFDINENVMVNSRTNSTIKLYDYYKPEYEVIQFYKIKEKCDFNASAQIPDFTVNVYNKDNKGRNKDVKGFLYDMIDYQDNEKTEKAQSEKDTYEEYFNVSAESSTSNDTAVSDFKSKAVYDNQTTQNLRHSELMELNYNSEIDIDDRKK